MNPRRRLLAATMLACLTVASTAQVPSPGTPETEEPTWDSFRVLVDRNIFLRSRTSPRPRERDGTEEVRIERDPDDDLVLVGTARQESVAIAFVEDGRTGQVRRATVTDAVGTGQITAITLDNITYVKDGTAIEIAIGHALSGAAPTSVAEVVSEELGSPGGDNDTATGSADADTAAILERMRQRRQQELNQ